jgi:FK506-binding nuclear protein
MLTATRGEFLFYIASINRLLTIYEINSRFEEVNDEESKKAQKRPRESDVADAPAKGDKKSKKLKAEDGKPIAVETDKKKKGGEKEEAKEESKEEGKEDGGKKEKKKDKKEKKKAGNTEESTTVKQTTASGVIIEDATVGTGPMAKKGNTVRMRYIGKLTDGKEFDKNTSGKPVCRWALVSMINPDPFSVHFPSRKG